jgi:hypothetical protein
MSPNETRLLFNFAASYSGGGRKRLCEYAKWFDASGGASFVIHPNCAGMISEYPHNRFFVAKVSRIRRVLNDCGYLADIRRDIGQPDLYYSYGIPVYFRFGRVNWFHLSNVLPLAPEGIPLSLYHRVRLGSLGRRIRRGFANCEVISAESAYSLGLIEGAGGARRFMSVNGSDDELAYLQGNDRERKDDIATVVGTYSYKALGDSYRVFQMLREANSELQLVIIGDAQDVPASLKGRGDVIVRGALARADVIACLRRSRFYISTTFIENSYNAAAEGAFMADESYISDIGPHRELLMGMSYEAVRVPDVSRPLLHVKRQDLTGANLKNWQAVVVDMLATAREALRGV